MTYLVRRLRKRVVPAPRYVITVPVHVTEEQADAIKAAWLTSSRQGVMVVSEGVRVEVLDGQRKRTDQSALKVTGVVEPKQAPHRHRTLQR